MQLENERSPEVEALIRDLPSGVHARLLAKYREGRRGNFSDSVRYVNGLKGERGWRLYSGKEVFLIIRYFWPNTKRQTVNSVIRAYQQRDTDVFTDARLKADSEASLRKQLSDALAENARLKAL